MVPAAAVSATLDFGAGKSVEAEVVDGTAVGWIPKDVGFVPGTQVRVTARDARGGVVYDGAFPLA